MAEFPALPLWTDAYLADTSHLSDGERGRYDLMIIHLWRMPEVRFPNQDVWLARKFGRSLEEIETLFRPLIREFFKSDGNWITQKRLTRERAYVREQSEKQRARANARWDKDNDACRGNATPRNAPSGNAPTPTPTYKEEVKKKEREATATRWPSEAVVSEPWKEEGALKRELHGLPALDLNLEAEKFVNYWSSKGGKDGAKRDWHKTWINWTLNAKHTNGNGKAPSANDKFLAGGLSLIREYEQRAANGDGHSADADPALLPLLPP